MNRRNAVALLEPWACCAVALGLAAWEPGARALPCLGVLHGPLAWALVLAAAVATATRLFPGGAAPIWGPRFLLLLSFLTSATIGVRYVERLTASGDEPHYLLMAQSLWKEGDLDLRDNVQREDYREYFPGTLAPHLGAPRADGRPFPAHSPGLPALLAPFYGLGGRVACVLLFALLAAALTREVHALAHRLTADPRAALFAGVLAMGPPVLAYSFHLYTELPSALAVALALRILAGSPIAAAAAGAALAASALPWLHLKMIPAAAALGVVAVARLRGRSLATFLAVAGVSAVAFVAYYQVVFGTPTPLAIYGGGMPPDSLTSPVRAAVGLLLDRSFGLLPYAPAFVLAAAGLPDLVGGERRRQAGALILVGLAILAPALRWRMWWGGQCPPARFLVPLVPVLAVAAGLRVAGSPRGLARWGWPLVAGGMALALFMAARPEALLMLNRGDRPTRVWTELSGATPIGRYLPSLVANDTTEERVALAWLVAIGLLLVLDALARRRDTIDSLFRTLAFPLALALGVGIAVDLWARPDARLPEVVALPSSP